MDLARLQSDERGFSLIESAVSIGILTAVTVSVAQLFAVATAANLASKSGTSTAILATQKMEQLRGLTWGFGDQNSLGLPVTDTTTNLATEPPTNTGRGLNPSPSASLEQSVPGYVDYVDGEGKWIGTGASPSTGTYYVRRWSIQPLPSNPNNTLVLQVRVVPLSREARRGASAQNTRISDETWLVSVKTRKAP